ncbi:hypothetical protein NDN08_004186 [Rhodosorus marinus]|uniref:Alcohol dehydrogenase iron-type/glycerol dehydrogenase GldA domain-containing protein n=1 Tax=Rhodosorus marinus TaxID=101924 RepID=A0AAV8UHI6_9RHOD|nr:hypothetical protein NDN08_004186 [Rhodosorus marinus]
MAMLSFLAGGLVRPRAAVCQKLCRRRCAAAASPSPETHPDALWFRLREVVETNEIEDALEDYAKNVEAARVDVLKKKSGHGYALLEAYELVKPQLGEDPLPFTTKEPRFTGTALFPSLRAWQLSRPTDADDIDTDSQAVPQQILKRLGVSSVEVIVSTGSAESDEEASEFSDLCIAEVRRLVQSGEALRAAAIPLKNGRTMVILSAYPDGSDFALFDSSLGDAYLDETGWKSERFAALYPPPASWALPADVLAEEWDLPELSPVQTPKRTEAVSDSGQYYDPIRVWLGSGSIEKVQKHVLAQSHTFLGITGFNQARIDPLVWGLETESDDSVVVDFPGLRIHENGPGVNRMVVERGLKLFREREHGGIIAYGSGRIMDAARAIAALAAVPETEALEVLGRAEFAAEESGGVGYIRASTGEKPLPLILVPSGVGSEAAYLSTSILRSGTGHTVVEWDPANDRIVVADPRIYRRLNPPLVDVVAAVNLCWCIESLFARNLDPTSNRLATEGIEQILRVILSDPGQRMEEDSQFSALASSCMLAGSAREATGMGLAQALALGVAAATEEKSIEPAVDLEFVKGAPYLEEEVHCSAFARALLHLMPCVVQSGLIPSDRVDAVADLVVDPPTATRFLTYLFKQADRVPKPPKIDVATAKDISVTICRTSFADYVTRSSPVLIEDILRCAGLVED